MRSLPELCDFCQLLSSPVQTAAETHSEPWANEVKWHQFIDITTFNCWYTLKDHQWFSRTFQAWNLLFLNFRIFKDHGNPGYGPRPCPDSKSHYHYIPDVSCLIPTSHSILVWSTRFDKETQYLSSWPWHIQYCPHMLFLGLIEISQEVGQLVKINLLVMRQSHRKKSSTVSRSNQGYTLLPIE